MTGNYTAGTDDNIQVPDELETTEFDNTEIGSDDATQARVPVDETDTVEHGGGEVSGDDQPEPYRYQIKYKANGEELEDYLEFDNDGNFTPDTHTKVTTMFSKVKGLESKTQQAIEARKQAERQAEAYRVQAEQYRRQMEKIKESYNPVVDYLGQKPEITQKLRQYGMPEIPDTRSIEQQLELEMLRQEKQAAEINQFRTSLEESFLSKHPDLSREDLAKMQPRLLRYVEPLERSGKTLSELKGDILEIMDDVHKAMVLDGEFRNPALEKARQQAEKAKQQYERAKAVSSPLAGRAGTKAGRGQRVVKSWADVQSEADREALIEQRLGKIK